MSEEELGKYTTKEIIDEEDFDPEDQEYILKVDTKTIREKMVNEYFIPYAKKVFKHDRRINSLMILFSQYWNDGALDEVHSEIVYSIHNTPDLEKYKEMDHFYSQEYFYDDNENKLDPNLPLPEDEHMKFFKELPAFTESDNEWCRSFDIDNIDEFTWQERVAAVAPYCIEGAHQEMEKLEAYGPFMIIRAEDPDNPEMFGMRREWIDGEYVEPNF